MEFRARMSMHARKFLVTRFRSFGKIATRCSWQTRAVRAESRSRGTSPRWPNSFRLPSELTMLACARAQDTKA